MEQAQRVNIALCSDLAVCFRDLFLLEEALTEAPCNSSPQCPNPDWVHKCIQVLTSTVRPPLGPLAALSFSPRGFSTSTCGSRFLQCSALH